MRDPGLPRSLRDYLVDLQADLGAARAEVQGDDRVDDGFVVDGVSVDVDVIWQSATSQGAPAFWLLDDGGTEQRTGDRSAPNRQHLVVHLSRRPGTVRAADDGRAGPVDVLPPATTEPDR